MHSNYGSDYNNYLHSYISKSTPLHQPYRQTMTGNVCDYTMCGARCPTDTIEKYQKDTTEKYQDEKCKRLPSLLKNVLLHGKQTVKQNYYHADSEINMDMVFSSTSRQTVPNSQTASHNLYQVSSLEYHTSSSEISPTECQQNQQNQFFGNLQGQLQEYNEFSQNYIEHVQSHNYNFMSRCPSIGSMQYERNKPKQTTFNIQESQMDRYGTNNNSSSQRNKNIETSNYNNEQKGPSSSNIADYPWMYKRTNGK